MGPHFRELKNHYSSVNLLQEFFRKMQFEKCLKLVILFVSVMIPDEKIKLFSIFFKFVMNDSSPRRTSITWTHHLAIAAILDCFASLERLLFFSPEIRCLPPHLAKLITRTIILKRTLSEFQLVPNFISKIVKKIFIHFLCSSEPWIMAHDCESPKLLLSTFIYFIHSSRSFSSKKIRLSSLL